MLNVLKEQCLNLEFICVCLCRETEEDEDIELVTRSGASSQEHISAFAFGLKSEEQTSEVPCTSAAKVSATLETVALQHTVKNNSDPPLAFEHKQHSLETSEMNNHKNGGRLGNSLPNFLCMILILNVRALEMLYSLLSLIVVVSVFQRTTLTIIILKITRS